MPPEQSLPSTEQWHGVGTGGSYTRAEACRHNRYRHAVRNPHRPCCMLGGQLQVNEAACELPSHPMCTNETLHMRCHIFKRLLTQGRHAFFC